MKSADSDKFHFNTKNTKIYKIYASRKMKNKSIKMCHSLKLCLRNSHLILKSL